MHLIESTLYPLKWSMIGLKITFGARPE